MTTVLEQGFRPRGDEDDGQRAGPREIPGWWRWAVGVLAQVFVQIILLGHDIRVENEASEHPREEGTLAGTILPLVLG